MKLPYQLSYTSSVSPTHGHFYFNDVNNEVKPLVVEQLKIRGMKSNIGAGYHKEEKILYVEPHFLAYGNPVVTESCFIPVNVKRVYIDFSLRVESNVLKPRVCHCPQFNKLLINLVNLYSELDGFHEQARRIAKNLFSATWLFRNRKKCSKINLTTTTGLSIVFSNCRHVGWDDDEWLGSDLESLNKLTEEIADAFINNRKYWVADITAVLDVRAKDEIYPSQELVKDSKLLFSVAFDGGERAAALRNAKIGAGLCMIDDWYDEEKNYPIRVHEYGSDKQSGVALRRPEMEKDFYKFLKETDKHVELLKNIKHTNEIPDYIHYVISILIKGGLFGSGK